MCQTLHNILKSFAYDAIPATPAFCVQIQSDVQRPSDGGIDRLASLPPSLPPSLSFSPSASLHPFLSHSLSALLVDVRRWIGSLFRSDPEFCIHLFHKRALLLCAPGRGGIGELTTMGSPSPSPPHFTLFSAALDLEESALK